MGGQACVFYGAAQFSRDVDFLVLADDSNFAGLTSALNDLGAVRIAVPRFDPALLSRGHAVHFRCRAPDVEGLRIDVMTKLRGVDLFELLWQRRTTLSDETGRDVHLLSVPDLVAAKKTQREKDWPMIDALVQANYHEMKGEPTPERIAFWLNEARSAELLVELTGRFNSETARLRGSRPLLAHATMGELEILREALDAEKRAEQEKDRIYWKPLKRELEACRQAELGNRAANEISGGGP